MSKQLRNPEIGEEEMASTMLPPVWIMVVLHRRVGVSLCLMCNPETGITRIRIRLEAPKTTASFQRESDNTTTLRKMTPMMVPPAWIMLLFHLRVGSTLKRASQKPPRVLPPFKGEHLEWADVYNLACTYRSPLRACLRTPSLPGYPNYDCKVHRKSSASKVTHWIWVKALG